MNLTNQNFNFFTSHLSAIQHITQGANGGLLML